MTKNTLKKGIGKTWIVPLGAAAFLAGCGGGDGGDGGGGGGGGSAGPSSLEVSTGPDQLSWERDTITLSGTASSAPASTTFTWTQTAGPAATIASPNSASTNVVLPSITEQQILGFSLTATSAGATATDSVAVTVQAHQNATLTGDYWDPALKKCVEDAARANGFEDTGEFRALDCSGSAEPIRNLNGLHQLRNLEHLDISGSRLGHNGAQELVYLFALRSLRLVGAGSWQDFIYLTYVPELASVDFSDNPGIGCQRLRDLASTGIAVTANVCAEPKPPIRPGGFMSAVELNRARTRAFVSVESINAVYEVDVATHAVVRAIGLPGETYRLDLSADETTLYVTLKHIGSVAFVNLANGQAEIVNVGDALANLEPNDILEAAPNRVLVASAGPFHGYIALVRRDLGNSVTRAANGRIIAGVPRFGASADRSKIFIDEDDTLLRLDSTQPTLPVAAETLHRLNAGGHIVVSADGSRVYASIRDIFDGQSLMRVGATANPVMSLSADGTGLILPAGSEDLGKHAALFYDADTLLHTGTRDWGCDLEPPMIAVEEVPGGMLAADRNILCGTRTVPY